VIKTIKISLITTVFFLFLIGPKVNAQAINPEMGFDFAVFQKALVSEMQRQFKGLKLDTTLNYLLRAENEYKKNSDGTYALTSERKLIILKDAQEVAGYPASWATREKGNVNILNNELGEAQRIVTKYKNEVLSKRRGYDVAEDGLKKLGYVEFGALVINKNGTILYALVLDNNFERNSVILDLEIFEKALKKSGVEVREEK
jgi:hypothetical protein